MQLHAICAQIIKNMRMKVHDIACMIHLMKLNGGEESPVQCFHTGIRGSVCTEVCWVLWQTLLVHNASGREYVV